jgi:hypothetical protein
MSVQFQSMNQISKSVLQDGHKDFTDSFSSDPFKYVYDQKDRKRKQNVSMAISNLNTHQSKRDLEKSKLIEKAE